MLSVIYVLYSLFSHYFYGPPPAEVEEEPAEERRYTLFPYKLLLNSKIPIL